MSNPSIIYIEDDSFAFASLELQLSEIGYTDVMQATHGEQALALAQESNDRVIWIIDGNFPMKQDEKGRAGRNGPHVAQQIRTLRGMNEVMIGFSGNPDIFASSIPSILTHNLDKSNIQESIPRIKEILSRERTTPAV